MLLCFVWIVQVGATIAKSYANCSGDICIGRLCESPYNKEYTRYCRLMDVTNQYQCIGCKRAVAKLLNAHDHDNSGYDALTCDCQSNEFCRQEQRDVTSCLNFTIEQIIDPHVQITCDLAWFQCDVDTACRQLLEPYRICLGYIHYYNNTVSNDVRRHCRYTASKLWCHPKAKKLRNCACQESGRFECLSLPTDVDSACSYETSHGIRWIVSARLLYSGLLLLLHYF